MVITGRKKFSKLASSIAVVAVPLNQFIPKVAVAKTEIKTTPDTYSGVAVETMETVDRVLSVRDPSRMPASTPRISAPGTMTSITQSISLPVRPSRVATMPDTSSRKTVEYPQSPCRMPQNLAASATSVPGPAQRARTSPSVPSIT